MKFRIVKGKTEPKEKTASHQPEVEELCQVLAGIVKRILDEEAQPSTAKAKAA